MAELRRGYRRPLVPQLRRDGGSASCFLSRISGWPVLSFFYNWVGGTPGQETQLLVELPMRNAGSTASSLTAYRILISRHETRPGAVTRSHTSLGIDVWVGRFVYAYNRSN
jgi:hypothetical protein